MFLCNFTVKEEAESKEIVLNKHILRCVAEKIGKDWKKVAVELSFPEDDIAYFESEDQTDADRGTKVLTIWMVRQHLTLDVRCSHIMLLVALCFRANCYKFNDLLHAFCETFKN